MSQGKEFKNLSTEELNQQLEIFLNFRRQKVKEINQLDDSIVGLREVLRVRNEKKL